jgi:hypothetical protein
MKSSNRQPSEPDRARMSMICMAGVIVADIRHVRVQRLVPSLCRCSATQPEDEYWKIEWTHHATLGERPLHNPGVEGREIETLGGRRIAQLCW